jgi:fucose 4-O-acetylase-like acetyltransferase
MIVAMFLFYSGYGIMESIRKKSFGYVKKIPVRRIFKTLINFDIVVILFLIIDIIFKVHFKLSDILLSFVAWTSIGNSNWYILAILILYALAFIAFLPIKISNKKSMHIVCAIILTILTVVVAFVLFTVGKESHYYNTLLIFPLGVWFSILKPYIDKFVMKNHIIYFLVLIVGLCAFIFTHNHMKDQPYILNGIYTFSLPFTIWSFVFTLFIVLLTMKIRIKSFVFSWLGEHIFSVYMLQRIPMTILKLIGFPNEYKYLFVIISMIVSIPLAIAFDFCIKKLWSKVKI